MPDKVVVRVDAQDNDHEAYIGVRSDMVVLGFETENVEIQFSDSKGDRSAALALAGGLGLKLYEECMRETMLMDVLRTHEVAEGKEN